MLSATSLSFIFVAGALAVADAALPNQDLFVPSFPVVAYEVAAGPDATTYLVACPSGSNTQDCNFSQPFTLVQGPSTVRFTMSPGEGSAATIACDVKDKTSMACAATGAAPNNPGSTLIASTTVTGNAAETHYRAITMVDATSDLLTYPAPPTTTSTPSSTSQSSTEISTTTTIPSKTAANTTLSYPTITSAPSGTAPSYNTSVTSGSLSASSTPVPSTIPNAGMLSASSNLGGVIGVVITVGAFFLSGAL